MANIKDSGSWEINKNLSQFANRTAITQNDKKIFVIEHYLNDETEREATDKIISAAPELLEALKALLNIDYNAVDIQPRINAEAKAKSAIQKATII